MYQRTFIRYIIPAFFTLFIMHAQGQANAQAASKELIFVSDTQAPLWVEALYRKVHNNRAATKKIFSNISSRNPAAAYILGDVVSLGNSNRQWKRMDAYLDSLRAAGTSVHAVLGNHEVLLFAKSGQKKFQRRFADHVKTGYKNIVDSVAVVLLNSNFKALTAAENATQTAWYTQTLKRLDADPSVIFIITGCHHSPYSNSKVAGSSKLVQQNFLPSFFQSKKSMLFLSGHSHNFEHFRQSGKDFYVIGGGGGLQQPLNKGKKALPDLSPGYKPMFHYLSIQRHSDTLQLSSIFLTPGFTGFEVGAKQAIVLQPYNK